MMMMMMMVAVAIGVGWEEVSVGLVMIGVVVVAGGVVLEDFFHARIETSLTADGQRGGRHRNEILVLLLVRQHASVDAHLLAHRRIRGRILDASTRRDGQQRILQRPLTQFVRHGVDMARVQRENGSKASVDEAWTVRCVGENE